MEQNKSRPKDYLKNQVKFNIQSQSDKFYKYIRL